MPGFKHHLAFIRWDAWAVVFNVEAPIVGVTNVDCHIITAMFDCVANQILE